MSSIKNAKDMGMIMIYGGLPPTVMQNPQALREFKETALRVKAHYQTTMTDRLYAQAHKKPGTMPDKRHGPGK
jgi:hypothetical protein